MLTRASLLAIAAYQRWMSPYKGFSCAYRVMHGGPGCSGYAKSVIRDHGALAAPALMKERFAACKAAAIAMTAGRADGEDDDDRQKRKPPQRRKKRDRFCDPADACLACAPVGCGSSVGASGGEEAGSALPDCGTPDCGSSCSSCDAGSCMPDCSFGCCGN